MNKKFQAVIKANIKQNKLSKVLLLKKQAKFKEEDLVFKALKI